MNAMTKWNILIYPLWFILGISGFIALNHPDMVNLPRLDLALAQRMVNTTNYLLSDLRLVRIPILSDLMSHVLRVPFGVETVYAFTVMLALIKDFIDEIQIGFKLQPKKNPILLKFIEHLPIVLIILAVSTDSITRILALIDSMWDGVQDLRTRFR
jgi:hypothetical protein